MQGLLVLVPCGQRKIWDRDPHAGGTKAKNAYIGSPFVVNKSYAEKFGESWMILSAKYGFILPDVELAEPYNVTFKKRKTGPISHDELCRQVIEMNLTRFPIVVGLGGKEYRQAIENAFEKTPCDLRFPFSGLPVGLAMQATKLAISSNNPFGLTGEGDEQ